MGLLPSDAPLGDVAGRDILFSEPGRAALDIDKSLVTVALERAAALPADTEANRATHRRALRAVAHNQNKSLGWSDEDLGEMMKHSPHGSAARILGQCAPAFAREALRPALRRVLMTANGPAPNQQDAIKNLDASLEAILGPRDGSEVREKVDALPVDMVKMMKALLDGTRAGCSEFVSWSLSESEWSDRPRAWQGYMRGEFADDREWRIRSMLQHGFLGWFQTHQNALLVDRRTGPSAGLSYDRDSAQAFLSFNWRAVRKATYEPRATPRTALDEAILDWSRTFRAFTDRLIERCDRLEA